MRKEWIGSAGDGQEGLRDRQGLGEGREKQTQRKRERQ